MDSWGCLLETCFSGLHPQSFYRGRRLRVCIFDRHLWDLCSDGQRTTLGESLELRVEQTGPKEWTFSFIFRAVRIFTWFFFFHLILTKMVSEGGGTEVMEKGLRKPLQLFHLGWGVVRDANKKDAPEELRRGRRALQGLQKGRLRYPCPWTSPAFDFILFQNIRRVTHSEMNWLATAKIIPVFKALTPGNPQIT